MTGTNQPDAPRPRRTDDTAARAGAILRSMRLRPGMYGHNAEVLAAFASGMLALAELPGGVRARDAWVEALAERGWWRSTQPPWREWSFDDAVAVAVGAAARMGVAVDEDAMAQAVPADALDVAAIEARYEKATPLPWVRSDDPSDRGYHRILWHHGPPGASQMCPQVIARAVWPTYNADFIAHARADIPALCREVRRLERLVATACVTRSDVERVWEALGGEGFCPNAVALVALAERVGASAGASRREVACTGISARWCPRCGDCTCPEPEQAMDHPMCPLHAPLSSHGDE